MGKPRRVANGDLSGTEEGKQHREAMSTPPTLTCLVNCIKVDFHHRFRQWRRDSPVGLLQPAWNCVEVSGELAR